MFNKERLYHFCAMRQITTGALVYFDGTLTTSDDLQKENAFNALKDQIAKGFIPPADSGKDIVLLSLTRLDA